MPGDEWSTNDSTVFILGTFQTLFPRCCERNICSNFSRPFRTPRRASLRVFMQTLQLGQHVCVNVYKPYLHTRRAECIGTRTAYFVPHACPPIPSPPTKCFVHSSTVPRHNKVGTFRLLYAPPRHSRIGSVGGTEVKSNVLHLIQFLGLIIFRFWFKYHHSSVELNIYILIKQP